MTKIVSQLDAQGYLIGAAVADESPLEPDVFLLPGGCVDAAPIEVPVGKRAKWNGATFDIEDAPAAGAQAETSTLIPDEADQTTLQQIAALEQANPITHRMIRDLTMSVAKIAAAVTGVDPMVNPAVKQIAALEAQIAALRAQL